MDENTVYQAPSPQMPSPEPEITGSGINPLSSIKIILGIIVFAFIIFAFLSFVLPRLRMTQKEHVTLTYWGLWEGKGVMDPVIADFQRQHPNVTVRYVEEDPKQYRERLITRIKNGNGPDIFRFHNTWLPMLSGYLLPLPTDVISKSDFDNFFYPVAGADLTKNGAIYGIPLEIDTLSLFVNTNLFKSAGLSVPQTWDEFITDCRHLTVKNQEGKIMTAGCAMGTFSNVTHAPDIISLLFKQNGADLENLSASNYASQALDFYTSFAKGDAVWNSTLDPSILAFAKGNLAMYFGYSWDIFTIKSINNNLNFKIFSVPHLPGAGESETIASYWAEGVSAKTAHQSQALDFMKFLSQKETEEKLFLEESKTRLFGEPYGRKDLANLLSASTYLAPFVEQAPNASSSFFASDTYDDGLNAKMNAYLGNAVSSVLSDTSSQTAVDTLSQGVSQVLSQYGVR
ncbi:sugar ABC transporter substrate-binding protein [Patescibacteria group bacterium]|nr:sugar ABC transporter substrate-binding protein [Patescibacteria group bacterium]MCL5010281.1 sugar ABC transporter substrate-binding protein [Patescibacteria group bacterium]